MKADPYTTLGVHKNADADTIRKAHRKKAKRTHPDAGGNADEFREVNNAYLILRDPARRQQYDETGNTEQKDTAMQDLIGMFIQACEAAIDQPEVSPIDLVARKIDNLINRVKSDQAQLVKQASRHRKTARKIKAAEPNLLKMALENHADGLDRKAASAELEIERLSKMAGIIVHYRYEQEKPKPQQWASITAQGLNIKLFTT